MGYGDGEVIGVGDFGGGGMWGMGRWVGGIVYIAYNKLLWCIYIVYIYTIYTITPPSDY